MLHVHAGTSPASLADGTVRIGSAVISMAVASSHPLPQTGHFPAVPISPTRREGRSSLVAQEGQRYIIRVGVCSYWREILLSLSD
jgi:hypothetical protein